jgi:hypothetical protein
VLASFGVTMTQASPAAAYLTNCSVGFSAPAGMFSVCTGSAPNGGLNQQRAVLSCNNGYTHLYAFTVYGNWVNKGVASFAQCNVNGYYAAGKTYQLR